MKRLITILVLVVSILTVCAPSQGFAINSHYTVNKAIQSSVTIEHMNWEDDWRVIGSGTAVRMHNRLYMGPEPKFGIVTANHVLDRPGFFRACSDVLPKTCVDLESWEQGDWNKKPGSGNDWALVHLDAIPSSTRPARVRMEELRLGERVYMVGHPWGNFFVSQGILGAKQLKDDAPVDQFHAYAGPGSSGGGIYDSRGRLVGIIIAIGVRYGALGEPELQHDQVIGVPITSVAW